MQPLFKYRFWFWSNKLNPILSMLAHLAGYDLDEVERQIIKEGLRGTNDEESFWYKFDFIGKEYSLKLEFAFDGEEGSEMIHIRIESPHELRGRLECLDLFQSMFKELKE